MRIGPNVKFLAVLEVRLRESADPSLGYYPFCRVRLSTLRKSERRPRKEWYPRRIYSILAFSTSSRPVRKEESWRLRCNGSLGSDART
jgi:hypothetical protein